MTPIERAFLAYTPQHKELSMERLFAEMTAFKWKYRLVGFHNLTYGPVEDIGEKFVIAAMVADLPAEMHTPKLYELVETELGPEFVVWVLRNRME